jgi:hypothetical protein
MLRADRRVVVSQLRIGTSPRPVMATRLIVPEDRGALPVGTANCLRTVHMSRSE